MPITTTAEEPNLCGSVAMPIRVTDHVSRNNNTNQDMTLT